MAKDIQETVAGEAVKSVTEVTPHEADESSAPGPYKDLDPERPPVSTTKAGVEIAQSLVAGAGAGTSKPEVKEEPKPAKKAG
jgi:hypothetical protein